MDSGLVPMMGRAGGFQALGELERRLAAVLHDHAGRFFKVYDLKHVFERQRLEVQPVGGVVVGGYGFRVAVDHDGLVAVLAQRERGVHATVIELNALADAVRAAAEDDDLFLLLGLGLALLFIRGVHIRRGRGELGGAGIHALVHWAHLRGMAPRTQLFLSDAEQLRQAAVGEALALPGAQLLGRGLAPGLPLNPLLDLDQFRHLRQKPGVNVGQRKNFFEIEPQAEGIGQVPDALGAGNAQRLR